jgi:tripartite-type tricarboxylate transporter receptor subunit TctC
MLCRRDLLVSAFAVFTAVSGAAPADAQSYPAGTVRIVVPFGAGSLTDILARIIAEDAGKKWGQQVIVENRPGLPGTIAVARAQPDGLTLMLTSNGHAAIGYVNKNIDLDTVKDFAGITRIEEKTGDA